MSGLTKEKAIAFVKQGLGWRVDTDKDVAIAVMFDLVQEELERGMSLPWFIVQEEVPVVVTNNNGVLPPDFIRNVEDGAVYVLSVEGKKRFLDKRGKDWIVKWVQSGSVVGVDERPKWYALEKDEIFVAPLGVSPWTVYLDYYGKQTPVSLLGPGAQNAWLQNAAMLLCSHCGLRMAEDIEHVSAMQKFQTRLAAAQARLLAEIVAREYADREFVMGNQA